MNLITSLGAAAALASMASFVPQAWKTIRSRKTTDISVGMYVLTVAAFALWLAYGALQRQWPLMVSNGVCLLLSAFVLVMALLPRAEKNRVADIFDKNE
jgi:MtN3 and saliva related transmembrane protein